MQVFSFQHIGDRPYQEDAFCISEDNRLFIVCDGVGGGEDGAQASIAVVNYLRDAYTTSRDEVFDLQGSIEACSIDLQHQGLEKTAGTTIVAAYVNGNMLHVAHIGDSKIFVYRHLYHNMYVSKDHSVVQELATAGVITTEEEMKAHPMRNRITKALMANNGGKIVSPDVNEILYAEGDMMLLCSDGVIEELYESDILEVLSNDTLNFEEKCSTLSQKVQKHSTDNSTALIIEF